MRLLNTKTLQLKEFIRDHSTPEYAIVSHRWGEEEINFQDITSENPSVQEKIGYAKVKNCCHQADKDGFDWVWIDTCCIDKTSSAELSEAINSMYRWYQKATICYAYLADVTYHPFDFRSTLSEFHKSEWFQRGWTLQELVAPQNLQFFDKYWSYFGTKQSLAIDISRITSICLDVLVGKDSPTDHSIAERMSWAASRRTTRLEDEAYCMLGIFEVNMPLLYGEGRRAFQRLQYEILKQEEDYTILAWLTSLHTATGFVHRERRLDQSTSILSPSPRNFEFHDISHSTSPHLLATLGEGAFEVSNIQSMSVGTRSRANRVLRNRLHATFDLTPDRIPPPPVITSRGLNATLFVWRQRDSCELIAWTSCFYVVDQDFPDESLLICIRLELEREGDIVWQRKHCSAELRFLREWKYFEPMDLYLSLHIDPTPSWHKDLDRAAQYIASSRGQVDHTVAIYLRESVPGSIKIRSTLDPKLPDSHRPTETTLSMYSVKIAQRPAASLRDRHSGSRLDNIPEPVMFALQWLEAESEPLSFGIMVRILDGDYKGLSCRIFPLSFNGNETFSRSFWRKPGLVSDRDDMKVFTKGVEMERRSNLPCVLSAPEAYRHSMRLSRDVMVVLNFRVDYKSNHHFIEVVIERAKTHRLPWRMEHGEEPKGQLGAFYT